MIVALALVMGLSVMQGTHSRPVRDALLWGQFDLQTEPISNTAAARRWNEMKARAKSLKSRLPPPVDEGGSAEMVHGKRELYERMFFAAAALPTGPQPATDDAWFGLEVADFVQGMRPCYEWEGSAECPAREAEFAEFWMRRERERGTRMADFLLLFAGQRWICAADLHAFDKKPALAAAARRRSTRMLKQAAAARDPLVRYVAVRVLAEPTCRS